MYIETSKGRVDIFIGEVYEKGHEYAGKREITTNKEGFKIIKSLYTLPYTPDENDYGIGHEEKGFLKIELSDGYYGLPEYKIQQK